MRLILGNRRDLRLETGSPDKIADDKFNIFSFTEVNRRSFDGLVMQWFPFKIINLLVYIGDFARVILKVTFYLLRK